MPVNYEPQRFPSTEAPGASVFYRVADGAIYHTYSVYQRGLDMFITAYHYLDIVPKGDGRHRRFGRRNLIQLISLRTRTLAALKT